MTDEREIKRIQNENGTKRVSIMARTDGHYRFIEDSYLSEDGYTFWTPTHWSGVYETAEMAENDAKSTLPWLREINSN